MIGITVKVGYDVFDSPMETIIFGRRPVPFIASSWLVSGVIIINTSSPFWNIYRKMHLDIPKILIEAICHEELEIIINDADDLAYNITKSHRVIHLMLEHTGINAIVGADSEALRRCQEKIYKYTVKELGKASKLSIRRRHRQRRGSIWNNLIGVKPL